MVVDIRLLEEVELPRASVLVRESFLQGTAPLYSPEGIKSFLVFGCSENIKDRFLQGNLMAGAFEEVRLVGVIELRPDFHISMLFVAPDRQGKSVGKHLLLWALERFAGEDGCVPRVTVNSSPNAEGFYRGLGFEALEPEKVVDGIRFIPMVFPPRDGLEGL